MKYLNRNELAAHEQRVAKVREHFDAANADLEAQKPSPVELEQHPDGEEPLVLDNGVIVMAGDYYSAERGIAVAAADVGGKGVWQKA